MIIVKKINTLRGMNAYFKQQSPIHFFNSTRLPIVKIKIPNRSSLNESKLYPLLSNSELMFESSLIIYN